MDVLIGLLALEPLGISGGRIMSRRNTSTVTYMNLLSVIADPDPMAYRAIDGVATKKC